MNCKKFCIGIVVCTLLSQPVHAVRPQAVVGLFAGAFIVSQVYQRYTTSSQATVLPSKKGKEEKASVVVPPAQESFAHKDTPMIDHASFGVNDYAESEKFYDETLKELGFTRIMQFDFGDTRIAGYGADGKPSFWISAQKNPYGEETIGKARGLHIAFRAPSVEAIHAWYNKCLELGGKENGAPGPRPEYHPGYYGGFIIDPNGWRIEAVLHTYKK